MEPAPQARRGYSQDQRPDGLAGVMAAVQTAECFPLADEAMPGNPRDQSALKTFLKQIKAQSGKGQRREIMDRGIPSEETSKQRWDSDPLIWYLVGTPHARWKEFAAERVAVPWQRLQDAVDVKLLGRRDEVYGRAKSQGRATKQVAMRRSQLARLRRTLRALRRPRQQCWKRDTRRLKLGAARKEAGWAWALVKVQVPPPSQPVHRDRLRFERRKDKLQAAELRDGHYLVRSFRAGDQAGTLWECDRPWTDRQAAFKSLKGDLSIGPFRHHLEERIEAHLLGCFLAYGLRVTWRQRLAAHAPGWTSREVWEKLWMILMWEVHRPSVERRERVLPRYPQPEKEHRLVLETLGGDLPPPPPPRIGWAQVQVPGPHPQERRPKR